MTDQHPDHPMRMLPPKPEGLHSFRSQEDDLDRCTFCGQGPNSAVHRPGAPR